MKSTVDRVAELIAARDPARAERYKRLFGNVPDNEIEEVVAQNRFWRCQLASLKVSTISERECLIDTLTADDWMRHFTNHVMQAVHRHQLPAEV